MKRSKNKKLPRCRLYITFKIYYMHLRLMFLSKRIPIHVKKDIIIEIVMTISFIISNWFFGFWGMLAYILIYLVYLYIKKVDIKEAVNFVRSMR